MSTVQAQGSKAQGSKTQGAVVQGAVKAAKTQGSKSQGAKDKKVQGAKAQAAQGTKKVQGAQGAKTQGVKTQGAQGAAVKKVRKPAKELMANRKRMFFGPAYMAAVTGLICRDHDKMIQHALHLKLGTKHALQNMEMAALREKLAEALKEHGTDSFSIQLG